jgi:hypothetical protein
MQSEIRGKLILAGGLALAVQAAVLSPGTHAQMVNPVATTRGFVVTKFLQPQNFSLYKGDEDCPDGYSDGLVEITLAAMPSGPEKDRLTASPKDRTYAAVKAHKFDECVNPTAYQMPPVKPVKGSIAPGMNLDGVAGDADPGSATTCVHAKFVSPTGERGIDNQFYRAFGCTHAYREKVSYGGGYLEQNYQGSRKDGAMTMMIEVTGVTDPKNDDKVEVGFYSSPDATLYDAQGRPIPNNSLSVLPDPRYRAVAHGRIKDGILTTDPVDIQAYFIWAAKHDDKDDYYIRGARLRLELLPNGEAKGSLGGYLDVERAYRTFFNHGPGAQLLAAGFGYTCPSSYAALHEMADGYKDPKTGQCTGISTAFDVEAVPAFIIHDGDKTAAATAPAAPGQQQAAQQGAVVARVEH